MGRIKKRGVFFSTDAVIALTVILIGILIVYPIQTTDKAEQYVQQDLIKSLSALKIGEMNSSLVQGYKAAGLIRNPNASVLEQIGEFYVANQTLAKELAEETFSTIQTAENIGIWFGGELVAAKNTTPITNSQNILADRQIISGIQTGGSVTAFSARAFIGQNLKTDYFYFGGYVGEGNITARAEYYGNISSATLEIATTKNFDVYINNLYTASYNGSNSEFTPQTYQLPTTNFNSGVNTIELKGTDFNLAGGFLKISYQQQTINSTSQRQYLPGITGLVNLYDGVAIPGNLTSMEIYLHINNSIETFLFIGNKTVYYQNTSGEEFITLDNTYLSGILDYEELSQSTTPIRLGVDNGSRFRNGTIDADIYSVTSLSGNMNGNMASGKKKIDEAIDANTHFVDILLEYPTAYVGLVGYESTAKPEDYHELSRNQTSLNYTIEGWKPGGSICVCCGVNAAINHFANESSPTRAKTAVVMGDGEANSQCPEQNTGSATNDAIQAACDAYNNHDIRVYTIGFDVDTAAENMLISMASCANGSYYQTVDNLTLIYENIAKDLLELFFKNQTLQAIGSHYSKLYEDSYIELEYETENPFGLLITSEKEFDDENSTTFTLPENSTLVDARVISYSGTLWTNEVLLHGKPIYNISEYQTEFLSLGDPYSIGVPREQVTNNISIELTTASSPENKTGGSISNKLIYTISRSNAAAYSSLSGTAQGCTWHIEFENLPNITTTNVPNTYSGTEHCYYTATGQNITNTNDAMQVAVQKLLQLLDFDSDGIIDVAFNEEDLEITSSTLTGIPYSWSTEMQVRTWT